MNICFFIGKIVSKVNFKFIVEGKNTSIAMFEIQLENNSIIKIKGYDEIADFCLKFLKEKDTVLIQGRLNQDYNIIGNKIIIL